MQYATTADGVRIAFGVAGSGQTLVRVPSLPFSNTQRDWDNGSPFYAELAARWRVVQFDPRGTGMSDRDVADYSLEARLLDIDAVVEKLDLGPVALHPMALMYVVSGSAMISKTLRIPKL